MADNGKSGLNCKSCGSSEFETENGYKICTNCGHVNGNGIQLADDPMQTLITNSGQMFSNQSVHNSIRNELLSNNKTTPVQQMGLQMAETLAINYNFNSEMRDYLMNYYRKALNHKNFFRFSLKNKKILSAVCAYITLMNNNDSIAIQYICSAVDCNGFDFAQIFTLFVNTFPETKPQAKPIEELVPSILTDFHINEQELNQLKGRVIDIISIEKTCWLVDGRSPFHLITAATYLGWKSLQPKQRAAIDFTAFCKTFGIPYKRTCIDRIKELNDAFIRLAQLIPWVKARKIRVHRNNIAFFIEDITQYPNSLIFDLKKDVYKKLSQIENYCKEDIDFMNSFKRKSNYDKNGSHKRNKSEAMTSDLNDDNEPDISDTEISAYLRNENEIKIIKKLRKRAKRMEKESNQ